MNVKEIMPFHLFQYNGKSYVINVEKMRAETVDDKTAETLSKIYDGQEKSETPDLQVKLHGLGLLLKEDNSKNPTKSQEHVPVTNIALLVTQGCNLRCVYCYEDKTNAIMDEKTAFQAVDWLIKQSGDMKSIRIIFFGGEPLLNFSLIKAVVEYVGERTRDAGKKVEFSITTNGTLLNDAIINFLKEYQFAISISFDGLKELQDAQRPYSTGSGSYDSIVPNIKKLLKVLPQASGHAVIMGNTSPDIVTDALQEIGFTRASAVMNSLSLFTTEQENIPPLRDTSTMVADLYEEAGTWLRLIDNRDYPSLKKLIGRGSLYKALLSLLHNTKKNYFCGAGRGLLAVSPSGDTYLCHRFVGMDEFILGNIDNLVLDNEIYHQSPVETNEKCKVCFARFYCGGGCKHDNASSCGSVFKPDERMCHVKRQELELAAVIVSQLTAEDLTYLVKEKIFPMKPCPFDF